MLFKIHRHNAAPSR